MITSLTHGIEMGKHSKNFPNLIYRQYKWMYILEEKELMIKLWLDSKMDLSNF